MRVQSISSHSQIFSAQLNLNIYGNEKSINRAGKIWFRNVLENVISVSNARKDYFVKNKILREFKGLEGIRRKQIIFHIQRKLLFYLLINIIRTKVEKFSCQSIYNFKTMFLIFSIIKSHMYKNIWK